MTEKQLSAYIAELLIEFSHGSQYTNVYLFADKWAKRIMYGGAETHQPKGYGNTATDRATTEIKS